MWTCNACNEKVEDQFDACWSCQRPRGTPPLVASPAAAPETPEEPKRWRMDYEVFRGTLASWEELFSQAADFASDLGPQRVISVSHSEDGNEGVVTVWYWTEDDGDEEDEDGEEGGEEEEGGEKG